MKGKVLLLYFCFLLGRESLLTFLPVKNLRLIGLVEEKMAKGEKGSVSC